MSLWGVHIGIAVCLTSLVVGYFQPPRDVRWLFVWGNGVFATVPDWWWVFTERFVPRLQNPTYAQVYKQVLHDSPLSNLFWFHGVIDRFGTDTVLPSVLVGTGSVAVFLLVEYYVSRRELVQARQIS